MAWWITVYCTRSVADITGKTLLAGIRDQDPNAPAGVDYYTLAEDLDLDEERVDAACAQLRVTSYNKAPIEVALHYSVSDDNPVLVHCWHTKERVAEELGECADVREPPPVVAAILEDCREIVALELGFSQLGTMGFVFAVEAARYIAQRGGGVIVDDDNQWFVVCDGAFEEP